jgi:hypothetical protein
MSFRKRPSNDIARTTLPSNASSVWLRPNKLNGDKPPLEEKQRKVTKRETARENAVEYSPSQPSIGISGPKEKEKVAVASVSNNPFKRSRHNKPNPKTIRLLQLERRWKKLTPVEMHRR